MDRGIYAASSGGLQSVRRLEIVSNNLANVNTVGFKAERLQSRQQEFADTLAGTMLDGSARAKGDFERAPGVVSTATVTDFSPGPIESTGNPLDVALRSPNQFFVVTTPEGEHYTRAGNFTVNVEGQLVTQDGLPVVGDGGPISVPPGKVDISASGTVTVGNQNVGRLRVVQFDDLNQLERAAGTRFKISGGNPPQTVEGDLVPGALEQANVGVVDAMVDMINAQKAFEAYTKSVRTIDELNERAVRNTRATT